MPWSRRQFLGRTALAAAAVGVFGWLAIGVRRPALSLDVAWLVGLSAVALVILVASGALLWKRTRFS